VDHDTEPPEYRRTAKAFSKWSDATLVSPK
jgi:hypothetical protein